MTRVFTHYILLGACLVLMASVGLTACSDEESFTTDRSATMTFSQQVVQFDTVLVDVSSYTERLLVYNNNDKAVHIQNVKLLSGGTSGFKMNVDGQFGTSIDDVDVSANDSIFVFVEVKAPRQATNDPTLLTDEIVFTLESGMQQSVQLEAYGQNVQVMHAEHISGNTTLDNSIPHLIYDSLVVDESATLTIGPGTTLLFHNGASLLVHGALNINGTQESPVTLRGDRLDRMFDYLPYDRLDNQWGGITLFSSCTGCAIEYADLHSGNYGIKCEKAAGTVSISNSVIHNMAGNGLALTDTKATVVNTQVSNTKGHCVSICGGTVDFYHCTLAQFYPWSGDRGHAIWVSNTVGENEAHPVEAANFYNCFVTGYADDEVYGNPGDQPLPLHFDGCVLLTDVSDATYFTNCTAETKEAERYKEKNFKIVDTENYAYDFHLDERSIARGKGQAAYSELYPTDHDGHPRGELPDAGCYQFR